MKASQNSLFKTYISLTKPGIIRGNVLSATGGFLFACQLHISVPLLIATLLGISLVIASACVCNNYIDKDIDKHMARTKSRALVQGSVSDRDALIFAGVLGILGAFILGAFVNVLVLSLAIIGFLAYVFLYGYAKRHSVHGTLVGSISGAIPLVVGYCAVTGQFDRVAFLLFLIMALWQMPHFFAISLFRSKDYKNAQVPVISVVKGVRTTKLYIVIYIALFTLVSELLALYGYVGITYLIVMGCLGLYWFIQGVKGIKANGDSDKWARSMFGLSLVVLLVFCVLISFNAILL